LFFFLSWFNSSWGPIVFSSVLRVPRGSPVFFHFFANFFLGKITPPFEISPHARLHSAFLFFRTIPLPSLVKLSLQNARFCTFFFPTPPKQTTPGERFLVPILVHFFDPDFALPAYENIFLVAWGFSPISFLFRTFGGESLDGFQNAPHFSFRAVRSDQCFSQNHFWFFVSFVAPSRS